MSNFGPTTSCLQMLWGLWGCYQCAHSKKLHICFPFKYWYTAFFVQQKLFLCTFLGLIVCRDWLGYYTMQSACQISCFFPAVWLIPNFIKSVGESYSWHRVMEVTTYVSFDACCTLCFENSKVYIAHVLRGNPSTLFAGCFSLDLCVNAHHQNAKHCLQWRTCILSNVLTYGAAWWSKLTRDSQQRQRQRRQQEGVVYSCKRYTAPKSGCGPQTSHTT